MSLDDREPAEEFIDPDLVSWTPKQAPDDGECGHCNEDYHRGDRILVSDDDGSSVLHLDCWENHTGFMHAMATD